LLVERAEQVEIRVHGDRAVDGPAVGVEIVVTVGGGVAALHVVVGHAVGGRSGRGEGERGYRQQRGGDQGSLHRGTLLWKSCCGKGPARRRGRDRDRRGSGDVAWAGDAHCPPAPTTHAE